MELGLSNKYPQVFSVPGQPWNGLQPVLCNSEMTALIVPVKHLFYKRPWSQCARKDADTCKKILLSSSDDKFWHLASLFIEA